MYIQACFYLNQINWIRFIKIQSMKVIASPRNLDNKFLCSRPVTKVNTSCIFPNTEAKPIQHNKSSLKERKQKIDIGKNIPNFIKLKQAQKTNQKAAVGFQVSKGTLNAFKQNYDTYGKCLAKMESNKSFDSYKFLKIPTFFKPQAKNRKGYQKKFIMKQDNASDSTIGGNQENTIQNKVSTSKSCAYSILRKVASETSLKQKSISLFRNCHKISKFKMGKKLGQGKCGKVYLTQQIYTKMIFAIKVIQKKTIRQQKLINQLIRELSIQLTLNHPNIIKVYDIFDDLDNVYIVQEFAAGGNLYELMNKKQSGVSQETTSYVVNQILTGLDYLHSQQIFHRDIKPQNIMLMFDTIKITDFGCAIHKIYHDELRNTFIGTPLYLSPQLILGCPYNQKVDLWALGVLTYELAFNQNPFQIKNQYQLKRIVNDEINYENIEGSLQFKRFLSKLLEKNPCKRLKASQMLQNPFIIACNSTIYCEELLKDN